MASIGWEKTGKRWRVFWHVTLPNGTIDKGSKSFLDKETADKFKEHCEKKEKLLKRTAFINMVLLNDAVDEWKSFCQGYTEETKRLYISEADRFISYLPDTVIYISDLTKFHINNYLNNLMSRGLTNKTINNSLCVIKSLCHYLQENYKIPNPSDGIKKLKENPPEPNFLTKEEYKIVLNNCAEIAKPWVRFMANTGLRATEFCRLKWKNCDLKNKTITIVGKGRKKRTICLNENAIEILKNRKIGRNVKSTDPVFLRWNEKEGLSRYCLSSYIGKACGYSGIRGGPHALRHFFATQLLMGGVPIIKVSALLGHSTITTTQRHYSHILSKDLVGITNVLEGL